MSTLTVSQGIVGTYNGDAVPSFIRLYANQTFTESGGARVPAGSLDSEHFYREIAVSFSGTTVTIPSASIYTTTDSNKPDVSYTMALYAANGDRLGVLYTDLRVSPTLTPATWQNIETFSRIRRYPRRDEYYSKEEVNALIAAFDADNPAILALQEAEFADDYASFSAAVTAIGSSVETHLIVTQREEITSNLTIPDNIRVSFWGNGGFTIKTGVTLTIGKMDSPGNRQCFWFEDDTADVRFLSNAVEKINVRWFVSDVGDCTFAVNQALASCTANGGGVIYLPQGDWETNGNHAVCSNLVIEGDGIYTTSIAAQANTNGIFTHGANIYDVTVRDLTLDGSNRNIAGYICSAAYGDGSAGKLRFERVKITACEYGLRIHDTLTNQWQMAAVSFDAKCWLSGNTYGIWCNTLNNVGDCDAFFEVGASQWAGYFTGAGQWKFTGEFAGSTYNGEHQVESQTIVAASGITVPGIATAIVTAAGMAGSPKTVNVNLNVTDHTSAALIATAYRKALGADPSVSSFFHVGGTGAGVELIRLDAAANDATMNLAINTGTATGITNNGTSTNTTAGVADTTQAQGFYFDNAHGTINFISTQDEGFRNFIVSDTSDYNSVINFYGCLIQSPVKMNGNSTLNTFGCTITDRSIRDALNANVLYTSRDDQVFSESAFAGLPFRTISARRTHNFSGDTAIGSGQVLAETIPSEMRSVSQLSHRILHNSTNFFDEDTRARLEILTSNPSGTDWVAIRVGESSETGEPTFYYDFVRRDASGRLVITGNQTATAGAVGLDFNGDITATNFRGAELEVAQITSNQNNWNPGGSQQNLLVTTDASRNVTGMTFDYAQNGGDVRVIWNIGANNLVIVHQSASSTSGNRFLNVTGADLTILPNEGAMCFFDGDTRRWRTFPLAAKATSIVNTPAGTISATTVQAAIDELDTEKAPLTSPTLVTPNIGAATGTSLLVTGTVGIGYTTGAGGAVTQITSRTTGVTLNKTTGAITLFSAAGSATPASFTVTNSTVAATDVIIVNQKSGTDNYIIQVTAVSAGSFQITSYTTGGTTTEQPVFNFCVLKGVAS